MSAKDKIIVALDFPSADAASRMAESLKGHVGMFKVGKEVFTAEGPVLPRYLAAMKEKVFLDLKYHDIPNTVRAAAREAARLGVSLFNVHAAGGRKMLEAAMEGAAEGAGSGARPLVLGVTVLTSLGAEDLREIGMNGTPEEAVVRLAQLAQKSGLDGVVASPREIGAIRAACGEKLLIVTPGVRPASAAAHDQTRIATPAGAVRAGADYLVIGRPITGVPDPVAAADAIAEEILEALAPLQA
jgi:orotidine-5'-phosphate decarboxylase